MSIVLGPGPEETPEAAIPLLLDAPPAPHHAAHHLHHPHHHHHHNHHQAHIPPAHQPLAPLNLHGAFHNAADSVLSTPVRYVAPALRVPPTPSTPMPDFGTPERYRSPRGGLNESGRRYFEHHGSHNLRAPVPHPRGPEGAARKKSFCARMVSGPTHDEHGNMTPLGKARNRWNC